MIYKSITDLIGHTPLLEAVNTEATLSLKARLLLKLECFNPGGSVKDRAALSIIDDAEARGVLKPGATIIEPTSGNTGIGLAWIGRMRGYRVVLTMPESMSQERRQLLAALGAEPVLTPAAEGMQGAVSRAEQLHAEIPGSIIAGQFSNPANPAVHERTTAIEIWNDTEGAVDIFVAGVGTGGTLTGTGRALKARKPSVRVIAVEPAESPVLGGGKPGPHKIQGIGANFVPANFDASVADSIVGITSADAIEGTRELYAREGVLAGVSSGAAYAAAIALAKLPSNEGKTIVALLPDTGTRYLSCNIF